MAKDLVRTRSYITKFYRMKAEMQAVSLRLQVFRLQKHVHSSQHDTSCVPFVCWGQDFLASRPKALGSGRFFSEFVLLFRVWVVVSAHAT